jgi:hypothetical protein
LPKLEKQVIIILKHDVMILKEGTLIAGVRETADHLSGAWPSECVRNYPAEDSATQVILQNRIKNV